MATDRLYSILNITEVPLGGTVTIPHLLRVSDVPIVPDRVDFQVPEEWALVSGDATTITVRNLSNTAGSTLAWVYAIHPVTRSFGLSPDDGTFQQGLVPRPFSQSTINPSPPFPDPEPVTVTIFVRVSGSDTTGNGTLAAPYRTFQRGIRDVPNVVPAGFRYYVDVTGIGAEDFPVAYQMPSFQTTNQGVSFGDASTLPFLFSSAVNVRATPKAFTGVPAPDATILIADIVSITAVTGTGLAQLTISAPRASWAANGAAGALLMCSTDASANCTVYASDSTHLFLTNTPGAIASQNLFLVEPSAEFHSLGVGSDGGGFECANTASICFQGIKFTIAGGGSQLNDALLIVGSPSPVVELCDVDGLAGFAVPLQLLSWSSIVRSDVNMEATGWSPRRSQVIGATFFFFGGGPNVLRANVFTGCDPLGPSAFATTPGALAQSGWEIANCLIQDAVSDGVSATQGGAYSLQTVQINTSAGDAFVARDLLTAHLTEVTGTGNGGVGVHVNDGAMVQVHDDATVVTGTGGDTQVGTLPVRTWTNFRTQIPTKNQYDLQTPFITNVASGLATPGGDDVTGAGTGGCSGSRLFQRA